MTRRFGIVAALAAVAAFCVFGAAPATAKPPDAVDSIAKAVASVGLGPASQPAVEFGTGLTECPTAGEPLDKSPKPLDLRVRDKVEQLSNGGDDRRVNQDYSCFPQNETSIVVNPTNPKNVLAGQNDYRLGFGSSGIDASTDNGNHWYDLIAPFPTLPSDIIDGSDVLDAGGDPAVVFDRAGVAYYVGINFNRTDDNNGIFAVRSTNGGFTWSRPCVVASDNAACGGPGDVRQPGDGVVTYIEDNNNRADFSVPFNDKEYVAAGPRPAGVGPVCFTPVSRTPVACDPAVVGVDRIYVTWTFFDTIPPGVALGAEIMISFSDDEGRSWSAPKAISGSAPFCADDLLLPAVVFPSECDINQFSTPTVHPKTGLVGVSFENFNTPDENQYLFVRSRDGGVTFEGPFFVDMVFDRNYPNAGSDRPDCTARGQQSGRPVLTNSCFRVNSGGNVVVDRRGAVTGSLCDPSAPTCDLGFSDDFYLVFSDNRNGTNSSSNTDVFFYKSTDGGTTWIGPTRVNNDPSGVPVNRDCASQVANCLGPFGNDQWFPWVDISSRGDLNAVFHDRRLDTTSTAGEWPTSRAAPNGRPGNYLAWFWGGQCTVTGTLKVGPVATLTTPPAGAAQCLAPEAKVIPQPPSPQDPGSGPVPGSGQNVATLPFKNFTISDVPHNLDYSFRAGIFMGDYNNVAIGPDNQAYAFWTDSRNGRGSGGPSSSQPGRNPQCEQADAFVDSYSASSGGTAKNAPSQDVIDAFSVTSCPDDIKDN